MFEKLLGTQRVAQGRRQAAAHQRGEQGMPAQMEEVARGPQRSGRHIQRAGPDIADPALQFVERRRDRRRRIRLGHRQAGAVDLAADVQRKGGNRDQKGGHHVVLQALRQTLAQDLRLQPRPHIPGQQLLAARIVEHAHVDALDLGLVRDGALDVAQLDAETTDLHLEIAATQKFQLAVRQKAPQIPGAVDRPRPKGIGPEFLGGQLGPPQISARDGGTANDDFPDAPQRSQLLAGIQQIGLVAAQGPAQMVGGLVASHVVQSGHDGGLGGAIDVGQIHGLGPEPHRVLVARLAAAENGQQVRQGPPRQQAQQRRRQEGVRDPVVPQQAEQRLGIAARLAGHHHQFRPVSQRVEDLQHAGVEIDRRELHPAESGPPVPNALQRGHEVRQHAAFEHDAFRLARGARRVDHIRDAGSHGAGILGRDERGRTIQHVPNVVNRTIHHGRHRFARRSIGDHRRQLGIAGDEPQPLGRHLGIERQIASARAQDAEDRLQHPLAARQANADQDIRLAGHNRLQMGGHGPRRSGKLGIAQAGLPVRDGRGIRHARAHRRELRHHVRGRRQRLAAIGQLQRLPPQRLVEQADFAHRPLEILREVVQHGQVMRHGHLQARDVLRRTRQHVERKRVPQIEIDRDVLRLQAMGKPGQQRGLDPIQHQLVMRLDVLVEQDGERPPVRLQPPQFLQHVARGNVGMVQHLRVQPGRLPQKARHGLVRREQAFEHRMAFAVADLIRRPRADAMGISRQDRFTARHPEQEQVERKQEQLVETDAEIPRGPGQ